MIEALQRDPRPESQDHGNRTALAGHPRAAWRRDRPGSCRGTRKRTARQARRASLTHMLVALGAAAFIIVGMEILHTMPQGDDSARIDPTRIIEGVIGGIGFLGAGTIIRSGASVQGITTGASIWLAGAIGIAAGVSQFPLAIMVTVLALIIMIVLGYFEREVIEKKSGH